jgi:hypothetical protein
MYKPTLRGRKQEEARAAAKYFIYFYLVFKYEIV